MDYEEVVKQRSEYLERKAERFKTFSEHAEQRAEDHFKKSDDAVSGIPMGQPILVGHHSQRRHEKALERSHNHAFKGLDELKKSENWNDRSERAEKLLERMNNDPHYAYNKIEEAQKDIRLWDKRLYECDISIKLINQNKTDSFYCFFKTIESANTEKERAEKMLKDAHEKETYWKNKLNELGGVFDISTLKKGDMVKTPWGNAEVLRVNKKSVTIKNDFWSHGMALPPTKILGKVI